MLIQRMTFGSKVRCPVFDCLRKIERRRNGVPGTWSRGVHSGHLLLTLPGRQFGVKDSLVPAITFGGIESGIGKLYEVALELSIGIKDGDTDADGQALNRLRRSGKKFGLLHRFAQAFGHE